MEQFSLEKYLENPSRKVCTRDGNIAEIIYTNGKGRFPVIVIDPYEEETEPWQVTENGKLFCNGDDDPLDLFFADEEEEPQSIEITFGAKDSEFVRDEYYIPEGCEARIEGNKVIIEKIKKEEPSSIEELLSIITLREIEYWRTHDKILRQDFNECAKQLLDLARKEILKDLPKLEKTKDCIDPTIPIMYTNTPSMKSYVEYHGYKLCINDVFEKLPKEE